MATQIGDIVSTVLQRVRDPNGDAHSRSFVRTILSHAQRVVNSLLGIVTSSSSLTTYAHQMVYQASTSIPDAVNIIDVIHNGRSLYPAHLSDLTGLGPSWYRQIDSQLNYYVPLGKDLLILYPARNLNSTVTVHYIKDTGLFAADSTDVSITKDFEPLMADVAEALLLLKQKDLGEAENKIKMIAERVKEVTP